MMPHDEGSVISMRILIADDSELVRRAIRRFLLSSKREVCGEAVDGADALRKAKELLPDIVLLDISMPGQNGLDAAILLHRELPNVKIIVMSQHDLNNFSSFAEKAGAVVCVDKNRLVPDLLAALDSIDAS
jgi:DNA-binding NarL/FixJ family response regulator